MIEENKLFFEAFQPAKALYFKQINQQWIGTMFTLEKIDLDVLNHPKRLIIDTGGYIWFAVDPQLGTIGTCALQKKAPGQFELTKMGVLESSRGKKVGEKLLKFVLAKAQMLDIDLLFLLTNAKCKAAIHLYEKNGFAHDSAILEKYGKAYERCDVAMLYKGLSKP